jgi:hypothetical protein
VADEAVQNLAGKPVILPRRWENVSVVTIFGQEFQIPCFSAELFHSFLDYILNAQLHFL